ncbi:MAG: trehalose-6-phosphate synthase [Alphaproteobacteria bacterium]|nr:trehalose-6-phosphate synthase [Alphaproteobacteria bacterium]
MIFIRFLLPLVAALCLVAYLMLPWTDQLFLNWSETDLQMRSKLVFSSIEDDLPDLLNADRATILTRRFTQLAHDQRLIGIGYCEPAGDMPRYRNKAFPADLPCPGTPKSDKPQFMRKIIKGGPVLVALFPLTPADTENPAAGAPAATPATTARSGYIMIVHDMSFAVRRSEQTREYVLWFVLGVSVLAAFITVIVARLTFSRWVLGLRDYVRTGKRGRGLPREMVSITREIQQRLRQFEREQQRPLLSGPQWSASTLFQFVKEHMASEQLITVSYRQPYVHNKTDKGVEWTMPASGLVTAIEPIMKACSGTWIAAASSDADRLVTDADGALMVPPDNPSYRLKRLWLDDAETAGFYAGFANEGVWPLCNMAYVKPRFRASDWEAYQAVNRKFADAVLAEAKSDAPIIFIQDYHFALLPKMIREKLPNAIIICFWHIPWPNSEIFGILPWRSEFLDGMIAADIIGFHTQFLCNNFIDCVDTYVEALIDREHDTIRRGGEFCMVRPYPISIAWPDFAGLAVPDIDECRREFTKRFHLDPALKLIVGVERLDYIKGIPERLRAFGIFLDKNPEWRGKVALVQIASPSRTIIPAYAGIDAEIETIGKEINDKFSTRSWKPVHILKQNFNQADVYKFYRASDVCIVSSLHDGMNLVAKEFIAAREDERGVLVLSQFAGSSRELIDALIVNPYDEEGMAHSLSRALTMGDEEQAARMKSMRERVRVHNVFAWAADILGDASTLQRRRQLNSLLNQMNPPAESAADEDPMTEEEKIITWPHTTPSRHS